MPIGSELNSKKENYSQKTNDKSKEIDFQITDAKFSLSKIIISEESINDIKSLINLRNNLKLIADEMQFKETHDLSESFILNLYGPPGTGKTAISHAIANELGKKLICVDYSEIESKYVGDTPKNLKKLFDFAKSRDDCLIFFDEADALLSKRVSNMSSSTDTSVNQTRSVLLNILNDFSGCLIFATNFVSNYDSAFMRRINRHIHIGLPDQESRHKIFKIYTPNIFHGKIDFNFLARMSEDLSPADIKKSTLLAAYAAAEKGLRIVTTECIFNEINKIKRSNEANNRKSEAKTRVISDNEFEIINKGK